MDGEDIPKRKERMMETDDVKVELQEEIHGGSAVVIGVELLYHVDQWFGSSKAVGTISTEKVIHTLQCKSNYLRLETMKQSPYPSNITQTITSTPSQSNNNPRSPQSPSSPTKSSTPCTPKTS